MNNPAASSSIALWIFTVQTTTRPPAIMYHHHYSFVTILLIISTVDILSAHSNSKRKWCSSIFFFPYKKWAPFCDDPLCRSHRQGRVLATKSYRHLHTHYQHTSLSGVVDVRFPCRNRTVFQIRTWYTTVVVVDWPLYAGGNQEWYNAIVLPPKVVVLLPAEGSTLGERLITGTQPLCCMNHVNLESPAWIASQPSFGFVIYPAD